jgi:N-acetylglucosamine-6-phosphate deacetylase
MAKLLIKGGLVVTPGEERLTDLLVENELIVSLGCHQADDVVELDAAGCYVTPGLFDIQVNGTPECDFWAELSRRKILALSRKMIGSGVTSILPTLITSALPRLQQNRDFLKPYLGPSCRSDLLLRMPGIHFEGPCLSPQRPGVHPPEHIQPLEPGVLQQFIDEACLLVTLAPELDPGGSCLSFLRRQNILVSLGHSNASFEEARLAFDRGITVMTHTFNALPPLHQRQPGAIAAALLDDRVNCCVIPDGLHVAPPMVELLLAMKGTERTVLVSDIAAVGTSGGGLVGSSLLLADGVRNMVRWGIASFREAVCMASSNPARLLNLDDRIGQIKPGAFADLLIWDRNSLELKEVIFNGKLFSQQVAEPQ